MPDGEEVVLGRGEPMETELEIGAGVRQLGFDGADGRECRDVRFCECGEGGHFLFRQVDDLGEDAVTRGIERRALLAFLGARTGGVLRVVAVGLEARFRESGFGRGRPRGVV
jgi:hypothetical protein